MNFKMTDSGGAALIYALGALVPVGTWIILLFVAIPENQTLFQSATSTTAFFFSGENPNRWWFVGWTLLPCYLLALSLAYLSSFSSQYKGRKILFVAAIMATLYSFIFSPLLGFVLLPAVYMSYKCIKNA